MYLYQRRTGDYLSVRGGLQIGWMTGLFCFIVTMVMLTLLLCCLRQCRRERTAEDYRSVRQTGISPKYSPQC